MAYIENEKGEILIGQQPDLPHKPYPLKWDLPGGKLEPDEVPEECIIREIKEETGYDVEELVLFTVYHNFGHDPESQNGIPGIGICYKVKVSGEFQPTEMLDMHYAGKEEIRRLDLTPWAKHYLKDLLE